MRNQRNIKDQWWEEGIQMGAMEARRNPKHCFEVGRAIAEKIRLEEEANIEKIKLKGIRCQDRVNKDTAFLKKAGGGKPKVVIDQSVTKGKIDLSGSIPLILGSYAFMLLALAPYRLAFWLRHLIAMGFAIGTSFSIDKFLVYSHSFKKNNIKFIVSAVLVGLLLLGQLYFAVVRGNLFIELARTAEATPVVEIAESEKLPEIPSVGSFYSKSSRPLALALILGCLGFEIGAGFFMFAAKERLLSPDVPTSREIEEMNDKMELYFGDIEDSKRHHLIFWEGFVIGANRTIGAAKSKGKRKGHRSKSPIALLIPIVVILLILFAFLTSHVFGLTDEAIIALDLTKSTKVSDQQGSSEFEKNRKGVEKVLMQVKPSDQITVIGITDKSFSAPFFILHARVGDDPGYFGEKLEMARKSILLEWRERSKNVSPVFLKTDIIGMLLLTAALFEESKGPDKSLYIFSDFRHYTDEVDLESPLNLDSEKMLEKIENLGLIAPLEGVKVYAMGVHSYGKSPSYWIGLKRFWALYFEKAGADIKTFSITREVNK